MSPLAYKAVGSGQPLTPNMTSYSEWRRSFSWDAVWKELGASPGAIIEPLAIAPEYQGHQSHANGNGRQATKNHGDITGCAHLDIGEGFPRGIRHRHGRS